MRAIVFSQIVAIFVGGLGAVIRFLSLTTHLQTTPVMPECINGFIRIITFPVAILFHLIKARECRYGGHAEFRKPKDENEDEEEVGKEYKGLKSDEGRPFDDWTLRKSGKEMKMLIKMSMAEIPNHLIKLLHQTPPSQQSLTTFLKDTHERCCTFIEVLTGIVALSIPSSQSQLILDSLNEILAILYYVDQRASSTSIKKKSHDTYMWWYREYMHPYFRKFSSDVDPSRMQLDQAIDTIKSVKGQSHWADHLISQEVDVILDFVQQKAYTSMDELHVGLEQLFVDVLNERLGLIPSSILKEINESTPEDLEKRVAAALVVVCNIRELEGLIQWSFPAGTTITSLVSEACMVDGITATPESNNNPIAISDASADDIQIVENQSNEPPVEGVATNNNTHGFTSEGDFSSIASIVIEDEIIQVE